MADILTPAELDAIRGRCEAMPPRPRCRCSSFAIQYEGGCMCEAGQWDRAASDRAVLILAGVPRLLAHVAALEALLSTAARELELSCYTDEAVTYQANKQRRLDLAARIRAALGASTDDAGAAAGEAGA